MRCGQMCADLRIERTADRLNDRVTWFYLDQSWNDVIDGLAIVETILLSHGSTHWLLFHRIADILCHIFESEERENKKAKNTRKKYQITVGIFKLDMNPRLVLILTGWDHLKFRQMAAILSKTIWNQDKKVRILNGPQFSNGWDYSL